MPGIRTEIQPPSGELFVGGAWIDSAAGRREITDPSTGEAVASVAQAGPAETDRAAAAARWAFDEGPWPKMAPRERGRILLRAAELLRGRAEEFARLESLNTGKPIAFSRTVDVATTIDQIEYYGALAAGIEGATRRTGAPAFAYTRREPIGVVAAVTPFNFPLILSSIKIAPALAAGNTVVHKPAEETPLTALRMAEVLQEAGVPDGVFNVLPGDGSVGEALVHDLRVDKIAFTGSTEIGRAVAAAAAQTLKHVTVELGGKAANIVFADADLDRAVGTAIAAFVFNTGQFCMAGSRLLVQRPVYEDVLAALSGAIGHVPLGDPFAETTVIGPMTGPRHLAKVRSFLDRADRGGAKVIGGGDARERLSDELSGGYWAAPTVLTDVAQDSVFVQAEIFGPVLTVQPFDTEDEAVRMANGTAYGLAAGLQTSDIARAHRVAERLRAGIVWVNGWALLDAAMPFGGTGQSGYGREGGPEGLDEYLQTKSVLVALS
jgi:acyl-CoA reductase-like NAD-dependent aldehyde dehydrogenase